jgi:hypothetical protein
LVQCRLSASSAKIQTLKAGGLLEVEATLKGSAMNRHVLAAIAAAATVFLAVGCSTTGTSMGAAPGSGPDMGTAENTKLCNSLRSYRDRGLTPELQESCVRQLGQEGCRKCLTAP